MNSFLIQGPDPEKVHADFAPILAEARGLKVVSQATADRAGDLMKACAGAVKFLKDGDPAGGGWTGFTKPKKAADEAHDFICAAEKAAVGPYEEVKKLLGMGVYEWREAERKKAAELARQQEEAARKAEEERQLADAIAAEQAGDKQTAEEILAEPIAAPVFTPAAVPKVSGISIPMNYKGACDDILALARHVIAHPEDKNLLLPNDSAINARAKSQKDAFKLPGCRLVKEPVIRTRVG